MIKIFVQIGKGIRRVISFWAGFAWTAALWTVYLFSVADSAVLMGVLGCGLYFVFYFILDLFVHRSTIYMLLLAGCQLSAVVTVYLTYEGAAYDAGLWFVVLVFSQLIWRSMGHLSVREGIVSGVISGGSILFLVIAQEKAALLPYVVLYAAVFAYACARYRQVQFVSGDANARYEALLDEYRKLKREARNNEQTARIEERTFIARKIHDSVGHKLTALLMQLEVYRMQADGETRKQAEQMKRLAQESLQETRSAVRTLKEEEPGGVQALMRLIRNLEAESYMQIEFVVRPGALSVSLDNEQSIAVYRSIQEALTNAMRHGSSRHVSILLESPGGTIFRFEVSNETKGSDERPVVEGFGLSGMRERIEKAGGTLEISRTQHQFIVRGSFILQQ